MATNIRTFSANLENYCSKLDASIEKAVAEAVVNSLHAHATEIDVNVSFFQDGKIEYVEIIDNGDGFTKKNLDSFFELHSDYKKMIGGKGVGRTTWFKFFSVVSIDSIFYVKEQFCRTAFVFKSCDRNIPVNITTIEATKNKTSVKMEVYIGEPVLHTLQTTLKPFLMKDMALMLYRLKKPFAITLNYFECGKRVEYQVIDKNDLPVMEKKYSFEMLIEGKKAEFTLHCIHLEVSTGNRVETGFVAGERTLSSFDTSLGLKVKAPTNYYTGQYWLLLESPLFNEGKFTSDDRERVIFPEGQDLWGNDVKSEVKARLAAAISSFFDHVAPDHVARRQEIINEVYDLYPQYAHPQYQKIIDEMAIDNIGRIDKHNLLRRLRDEDFRREYHFKDELNSLMKSKKINTKTIDEITESAEKTSEQAKSILSNYFWYRQAIIKQLEIFIENNEKSEELLHELFYKRHSTIETVDLQNCIWLLDDKFMSFSYFASEGVVSNVIKDIYGEFEPDHNSKKVMDLFIAFDRCGEDAVRDCVIIEFKALGADRDKKADAASQVRRKYAQSIRTHVKNIGKIFIFIITQIDEELKNDLRSDDFREAMTRYGTILNYYNSQNDANVCFISATTIIGDAKDRHELFFKLLKEELTQKQRLGVRSE